MKITMFKCNLCGMVHSDEYESPYLVTIKGLEYLRINSKGRNSNGTSKVWRYLGSKKDLHFCTIKCYLGYLLLDPCLNNRKDISKISSNSLVSRHMELIKEFVEENEIL